MSDVSILIHEHLKMHAMRIIKTSNLEQSAIYTNSKTIKIITRRKNNFSPYQIEIISRKIKTSNLEPSVIYTNCKIYLFIYPKY